MRDLQEELKYEEDGLKAVGTCSRSSRGRKYNDRDASSFRTPYQHDRDRIISSKAFGRLQHKTQVFLYHEGDFYRTRLTHSLEVAQIARIIAQRLGANRDLVQAISLAHDLGHPPFGHAGERMLKDAMREHGGFEHNRQSLRVVDELETRSEDCNGLNLTWETREGIATHRSFFDAPHPHSEFATPQPGIEAQIVNAADVIAYATHDLEDAIEARLLTHESLQGEDLWRRVQRVEHSIDCSSHRGIRMLALRIRDTLVQDIIDRTSQNIEAHRILSPDTVRASGRPIVTFSPEVATEVKHFVDKLRDHVYRDPRVVRMDTNAKHTLRVLFEQFVGDTKLLPMVTQQRIIDGNLHQVVCDYVSGMTDRHAIELYKSMFDPDGRSLVLSS